MKFYKDKDPYVYNESLLDKQNRKKREIDFLTRLQSALLAVEIVLIGTVSVYGISYSLKKENPFDGQTITSTNFSTNYKVEKSKSFLEDEGFKETIENIKKSDMDEKKAYLLYYALLSNESLTKEEKQKLTGYIQYFIDNKYLDYEYVYKQFSTLKLSPINKDLGYAGTYTAMNNTIKFDSEEARKDALTHEAYHSEDKSGKILSYNDYAWFIEGLTSVLNYEYFNQKDNGNDGNDVKAYFIRILCELVNPDILFKVRATGDMNILIDELVNKGARKDTVLELFKLFNDYNYLEEDEKTINDNLNIIHETLKKEISIKLIEIYNSIYNTPDFIKPIYFDYILKIELDGKTSNVSSTETSFYYFNSLKKDTFSEIKNLENGIKHTVEYRNLIKETISSYQDNKNRTISEHIVSKITQEDFTLKYNNLLRMLNEDKEKLNFKRK